MGDKELVTYHCLIGNASGHLLLLPADTNTWALPTVSQLSNEWFTYDVAAIESLVRGQFGLEAKVLRHLWDARTQQICELEANVTRWTPPDNSQWVDRQTLAQLTLAAEVPHDVLEAWLAEKEHGTVPALRAPWERPGWRIEASAWIEGQLAQLDLRATGPIEPFKLAWSGSAILRVMTSAGLFYFKAVYSKPPNEVAVIQTLAQRYPHNVPQIVAFDVERRWLLMAEFGGEILDAGPEALYPGAARRFAEIQIECAADLDVWYGLNCPDRTNARMAGLWRKVMADVSALASPANGLQPSEIDQLQAMTGTFESLWSRLEAYAIPPSIHLQDFQESNIAVVGKDYVYFDWGDCVIADPFLSAQRMLDYLRPPSGVKAWDGRMNQPNDGQRRAIRDAYLEPWTALLPIAQLREAFILSRYLNEVYQAVRWYLETAYLEPGCPWQRVVVDGYIWHLRNLLKLKEDLPD